jgi:hypothetical protein
MEWLTEYTHIDGSQWAGPTLTAESLDEARAAAMDYPMQPLEVLGEIVEVVDAGPDTRKVQAN